MIDERFEGIMINTAGGVTGGDYLQWDVRLERETEATLTTQVAEKIYRALDSVPAQTHVRFFIGEKSRLCWLPQETILFNCSALQRRLEVDMADQAELLLCEAVVFGRRLMGENMERASFRENWIVRRNNEIIHVEALQFGPDIGQDIATPVFLNGAAGHGQPAAGCT